MIKNRSTNQVVQRALRRMGCMHLLENQKMVCVEENLRMLNSLGI